MGVQPSGQRAARVDSSSLPASGGNPPAAHVMLDWPITPVNASPAPRQHVLSTALGRSFRPRRNFVHAPQASGPFHRRPDPRPATPRATDNFTVRRARREGCAAVAAAPQRVGAAHPAARARNRKPLTMRDRHLGDVAATPAAHRNRIAVGGRALHRPQRRVDRRRGGNQPDAGQRDEDTSAPKPACERADRRAGAPVEPLIESLEIHRAPFAEATDGGLASTRCTTGSASDAGNSSAPLGLGEMFAARAGRISPRNAASYNRASSRQRTSARRVHVER